MKRFAGSVVIAALLVIAGLVELMFDVLGNNS